MTKTCTKCNETKTVGDFHFRYGKPRSHCKACRAKDTRERYHTEYKFDPEFKKRGKEWVAKNREKRNKINNDSYYRNREKERAKEKERYKKQRLRCLEYYGGKCACCGEDKYEFLALDHIKGGGTKHRKEIGSCLQRWLVRNDFPEGFRVLCHNCNISHGNYGFCPHEKEKQEEAV